MKFFYKNELCRRGFSMVLAFLMVFTMFAAQLPSGILEVQAAENATNITVHYNNGEWNWTTPALQFWGGSNTTVSGYTGEPTEITGWGGVQGYALTQEEDNWYALTLTGDFEGFQFLDLTEYEANKHNATGGIFSSHMTQYTAEVPQDLYYDKANGKWYLDAVFTTELAASADAKKYDVTIHYNNEKNWDDVYVYSWNADGNPNGGWPGTQISENTEHDNWYDVVIEDLSVAVLNFKYTNNAGAETNNYNYTFTEESTELWVEKDTVLTVAPTSWTTPSEEPVEVINPEINGSDVTFRYYAPEAEMVHISGTMNGWNTTAHPMVKGNNGIFELTLTLPANSYEYKFVIDGVYEEGYNRTFKIEDSSTPSLEPDSDYYVTDCKAVKIGDVVYPMNVFANGVFEAVIDIEADTIATLVQNGVVTDKTVDVNAGKTVIRLDNEAFTAETAKTAVLVGNFLSVLDTYENWNPASADAKMTYLGNGLYIATLNFGALAEDATLEYKVAFDNSWDYTIGAGGVNGGNVLITIPAGSTTFTVLLNEKTAKLYNDVEMAPIKVNGADKNPLSTTVSLIGTVRGLGGDDWNTGTTGYEFTRISDTLYRYEMTLGKGTHSYKAVFDYAMWYEMEGSGNRTITLTKDDVKVVFLYDTTTGYLYDTVNNEEKVASLLSMKVKPAEMEITEHENGTVTFAAVAENGQKVTLYYGEKAKVETDGEVALTKVVMGEVSYGKSSSGALWLGDAALDLVYYYDIDGTRTLDGGKPSVTIDGKEYSNYARSAYEGRVINVPGTFPGPSWDAASNKMSYNGNRTYSYTFKNVPAAKYEFKIAVGSSWAENYGADGAFDGGNIKVAVPTAQDVTIYYSDVTHYAVNSIDYKFATITLSGKNIPEETKLTDEGLTGIYAVTLVLPAGTYSDFVINCDGTEYEVAEFELEKEKEITFCMDPVTSLFYHNASNVQIDAEKIYFDSKDSEYKSVFGAVATGEEVTFSLATGTDISSASLIVKGNENKSVAMAKNGEAVEGVQKWSVTISFSSIGEYTYYFAVANGSGVQVYGDDDGYYGTGTVAELTNVKPYDLVVYKDGFKTPDWMKNAVIYQIFPDRFYDGDASNNHAQETARGAVDYEFIENWYTLPENPEQEGLLDKEIYESTGAYWGDGQWSNEIYGGDLEGITERIDYLKALGVTVIYLNPVFSSISNHRYDACDYTVIDPVLGTEGDFAELVRVAEENGMKVVLDGVFNHVSDDSIYFDRYYKFIDDGLDTIGAYPYWAFVYDYMEENAVDKETAENAAKEYFTAEYGITNYAYVEWFDVFTTTLKDDKGNEVYDTIGLRTDKPVYGYDGWWGYDSMPIIKSTNGSEYQTGNWAEEIIYNEEGTSVTQYWISQGMDGWRLDVANEVSDETWQRFRESVKALNNGEAVIIGEIWDDATKYILGDMYDSVMNYMFRNAVTGFAMGTSAEETTKYMEKLRERYPKEAFYAMMNLVGSHDTTRILSYLDGIGDDRNQKDLDSAFPTYEKTSFDAKQRQYLVAFLQFTYAGAPTIYYGDEIGMVGSDDPDDRRAFEWGKGNKELVTYYATLAEVRNSYAALRTGSVETFDAGNDNILAYVRRDAENEMIVLANNGVSAATVTLDLAAVDVDATELRDLLDDCAVYEVSGDKATVTVAARRGVILVDKHAVKNINVNEEALEVAYDEQYVVPEASKRPVNKPAEPSKPGTPNVSDTPSVPNTPSVPDDDTDETITEFPSLPTRPSHTNRPEPAEDGMAEIEEIDTPLADGKTDEKTEEKESDKEEVEIVEDSVPLAAGEEESVIPMIAVLVVLLAACGGIIIVLQKKKIMIK